MGLELTTDMYPPITSQMRYPIHPQPFDIHLYKLTVS